MDSSFIAEFEKMDLSEIKDKLFCVAVSTGHRENGVFLPGTLRGPMNFLEMVEDVGILWSNEAVHAHVMLEQKERKKPQLWLDINTIDYIQAHYLNILMEGTILGYDNETEYTCKASILGGETPVNDSSKR